MGLPKEVFYSQGALAKNMVCAVFLSLWVASNSSAQYQNNDKQKVNASGTFDAAVEVGLENDSNVSVEELDADSTAGDSLWSVAANLNYKYRFYQPTELKFGYRYSQDSYDEFDQFDLSSNFVSADLSHNFGDFKGGLSARYISADLASEDFLTLSQISVNASKLLSKTMFGRVEYTYTDKGFESFADRESSKNSLGGDLYFFLDGSKKYWVVGYKYEDEDAVGDEFDRVIHTFKMSYTHKFSLFNRESIARVRARYQTRDYDSITPSINEIREDDRLRFGAELEIPLNEDWYTLFEIERSDYSSNLPSADYSQNLIAAKLGWRYQQEK